ncbi:unnamed protein product [Ascophyllum nodosum]
MDPSASWFSRHRRLVAMVAPGFVAYIIWWSFVIANPAILESFTEVTGKEETPNWYMCITMAFGSMLAGATSEGGASVAFPVMTLAFGILPGVARDFSFMIQSAGMTAAAATIGIMQVQVETHSIFYATIGGACGLALGLEQIDPVLEPAYSKMIFVCTWAAFACSLFWLNRYHGRRVFDTIPAWDEGVLAEISVPLPAPVGDITLTLNWKACALVLCGFVGGIFSSISGSGIDICTFSILTLLFRVSEKTATPTSVVLMAINTFVGYLYREFALGGVQRDAVTFFTVCVPIVVIGAPLGSLVGSHLHRLVLASFIYITDSVQFIGALIIVKPWTNEKTDTPLELSIVSASILIVGSFIFAALAKSGAHLLKRVEWLEKQSTDVSKAVVPRKDIEACKEDDTADKEVVAIVY